MSPRLARTWFLVHGIAVIAWWMLLAMRPAVRGAFEIRDAPPIALLAFAPADLIILGGGSLIVGAAYRRRWAAALAWAVAGATVYASLYTFATAVSSAAGWLGFALMAPAALLTVLASYALTRETPPAAVRRDLPPSRPGEPRT